MKKSVRKSSKAGRPPALDAAGQKTLLDVLRAGGSRGDAATMAGIAMGTIRNMAKRDGDFAQELAKAEVSCKIHHLMKIRAAGKGWQSSAWMLERKWPNEFGRKDRMDLTSGDEPINFTLNIGDRDTTGD